MELKTSILKEIKKNKECVRLLEDFHNKAWFTMQTWLKTNNKYLCHIESLKIISECLKKDIPELVTEWSDTLKEALIP